MKNFTVLYAMPVEGLEQWKNLSEEERKAQEAEVMGKWSEWFADHKDNVLNSISLGKTKKVSSNGVEDASNGYVLSSYVSGESTEAVANMFKDHPHLLIPGATIEIMEATQMPGM